jgi:hypothetical protein
MSKSNTGRMTENDNGKDWRRGETSRNVEARSILEIGEETIYVAEGKVILVPCSGIDEYRVAGEAETASSDNTGGERGGRGSESQEVRPSGQKESTSVHCKVLIEGVDTNVESEDDEIDLANK